MTSINIHVLLVEDNPGDARLIIELLTDAAPGKFEFTQVDRIETALQTLAQKDFDVVLLDLALPDGTGIDTINRICNTHPHLPVIVLTGMDRDTLSMTAITSGAQDYLIKGELDGKSIFRSIQYSIERKQKEQRLQFLATHDSLTSLPNRRLFNDRLDQAIERARRNRRDKSDKWEMAIMTLDLDHFKVVNDTFGHAIGDLLILGVADRLSKAIRSTDTVSRMGGDEFTLIFENTAGKENAGVMVKKVRSVFALPFEIENNLVEITASIGVSLFPSDCEEIESLLKLADFAMYYAKRERNNICFYSECKGRL
ncbi:MAG: diguanylate cyclase [Anaerolineaceae bacterium]